MISTDPEQRRLDAGWINRLIRKHPIRLPAIFLIIGAVIPVAAFLTGNSRLAYLAVPLLLFSVPMLIVGLVKKASKVAKGPIRCPTCDAVETVSPGFKRFQPRWVDYVVITCKKCGATWQEHF